MDKQPIIYEEDEEEVDEAAEETQQEQQHQVQYRSYWQRWYVLGLYGLLITFQGALWNTWGPLHDNMQLAYNWDPVTFGLLPLWGPFLYVVAVVPWTALLNAKGLRSSIVVAACFVFAGAVVKTPAAFVSDDTFRLLCHACGILNAAAAPALFTTPPMLAAIWFPANERVTATAVGGSCQSLAIAASFVFGPLFVPEAAHNVTGGISANSSAELVQQIHTQVQMLNYAQAAVAAMILACLLLYFPAKPPTAPAVSSEVARSNLIGGLRRLPPSTWLIVFAYGLPLGVSAGFSAAFDENVSDYGIGETQAGWMGFAAVMAGTCVSLVVASIIDRTPNLPMKWVNTGLLSVATACYAWFSSALIGWLPASTGGIYAANILANVALYSSLPIFYELACEAAFPIAEEVPAMLITAANCSFASAFLAVMLLPNSGTKWMNFVMTGACAAAVPLLALFPERHMRRELDLVSQGHQQQQQQQQVQ